MADITFRCGKCGQSIEVDAKYAGQSASCPACDAPVEIPSTPIPKGPKRTARAHALAKTSALTKCPACKGQVATAADICPHCAYPVARKQAEAVARERNKAATKQLLVILIVVLIGMGSMAAVDMVRDWRSGRSPSITRLTPIVSFAPAKSRKTGPGIYGVHGKVKQVGIMLYVPVNAQMTDGQFQDAARKLAQKYGKDGYAKVNMQNARNGKLVRMYEVNNGVATRAYHW